MRKHRKTVNFITVLLLSVAIFIIPFASLSIRAEARPTSSWLSNEAYESLYGDNMPIELVDLTPTDTNNVVDWLGEQIGALIYHICKGVWGFTNYAAEAGELQINLSLEGIVLGRLASPVNIFGFDLTTGNYYGIIGSLVYSFLRTIAYSGIFIMFLFILAKNLFDNTPKALDTLKESLSNSIISLAMLTLMPPATEIIMYLRDSILLKLGSGLANQSFKGLLSAIEKTYGSPTGNKLVAAVVYAAVTVGILFYAKDYVSLALQQTILFGFFPLFTVLGTGKKKFLADWANTFYANMAVPLVDIVILWIPVKIMTYYAESNKEVPLAVCIVIVMIIWASRQVRQEILKMFGSLTASPAGKGMGGLGQMVQMARMGSMMGQQAAGAASGVIANAAGAFAGIGGAGSESNVAAADSAAMSGASEDIMNSDAMKPSTSGMGDGIDEALGGADTDTTKSMSDEMFNDDFGGETTDAMAGDEEYDYDTETPPIENMNDFEDVDTSEEGIDTEGAPVDGFDSEGTERIPTEGSAGSEAAAAESFAPGEAGTETAATTAQTEMPEGLNQFDQNRWTNLNDLDNANTELDHAQKSSNAYSSSIAKFDAGESVSDVKGMESIGKDIDTHRTKLAEVDRRIDDFEQSHKFSKGSSEYLTGRKQLAEERESAVRALDNDRQQLVQGKTQADSRVASAQERVDKYAKREEKFASVSAQYGMSGRTYESASDMNSAIKSRDARVDAMREKARRMNLTKEDTKGFTPEARQEMAQIQMRRMVTREALSIAHKMGTHAIQKGVTNTTKAAGAVLSLAGAAAFAYGGEEASMAGIQMGSYAGQTAGKKINHRIDRFTQGASYVYHTAQNIRDARPTSGSKPKTTTSSTPTKSATSGTGSTSSHSSAQTTPQTSPRPRRGFRNEATPKSPIEDVGSRGASQIKLDK